MKTLAIIAQKGGVGKTTLAVHIAFLAAMKGKAVVFLDIDPQGTGVDWIQEREKENELVAVGVPADQLGAFLKKAEEGGADLVVIDTAPSSSRDAATAAGKADFVLVPCTPSKGAMKTLPATLGIINRAGKPYSIALNGTPLGGRADHVADLMRQQGFKVLNSAISRRVALDYCNDDGQTVFEYEPESKAAREIEELYSELAIILKDDIMASHNVIKKGKAA